MVFIRARVDHTTSYSLDSVCQSQESDDFANDHMSCLCLFHGVVYSLQDAPTSDRTLVRGCSQEPSRKQFFVDRCWHGFIVSCRQDADMVGTYPKTAEEASGLRAARVALTSLNTNISSSSN